MAFSPAFHPIKAAIPSSPKAPQKTSQRHSQDLPSRNQGLRPSGIDVLGSVPWGTHFCQFYATSQDLVETLVPYFRAGLEHNEFCMWVTSKPLQLEQAVIALRAALPDLDERLARRQIEILDYTQWYTPNGRFDADQVLQGWTDKLAAARQRGFEGLRLTGNTFWLEEAIWQDFTRYEAKINEVIAGEPMLALCTYSLEKCGVHEILDVVTNHQFALIKNAGHWEIIESAQHKRIEQALRESEARYHSLFEMMTEGFALHEIVCDEQRQPCNYRFIEVNSAFERLTGLKREDVIGRLVTEVLPGDENWWIERYGKVALTGEPAHFENYSSTLHKFYSVFAYRPAPGQFAAIFIDTTARRQAEDALLQNIARVEVQHRLIEQREQERQKIARDLHDGPVQALAGVNFTLQGILMDGYPPEMTAQIQAINTTIQEQIADLRAYASELRPPTLSKFGLGKAIRSHLDGFREKHAELTVQFDEGQEENLLSEEIRLALFRIYQETLTNIAKHSHATQVTIHLAISPEQTILEIRDNGIGFDVPNDWLELARQGHLGLVGIRERSEAIGGEMQIHSAPGKGTELRITALG